MELWIRSQDREKLMECNFLSIKCSCDEMPNIGKWMIYNGLVYIGEYKTKERALEILDEIQNILQPKLIWKEPKTDIKHYDNDFLSTMANNMIVQTTQKVEYDLKKAGQFVYQMPEE